MLPYDLRSPALDAYTERTHLDESSPLQTTEAYHSLAPQNILLEQRTGYIGAVIMGCIVVGLTAPVVWLFGDDYPWIPPLVLVGWLLLLILLVWSSHFWPRMEHRYTSWCLDDTGLEIRRGVFWKHRIAIPVARVQHVDVSQGPMQRMFDLGTLTVHTAGTRNAAIQLAGLEHSTALQLRDRLIEQKDALDVL